MVKTTEEIVESYAKYCNRHAISFKKFLDVMAPDDTTFFCSSGMQKYKNLFSNEKYTGTTADVQSCIRLNDFDEIGDRTHLLLFDMIGLFSFREMTMYEAVDFFIQWLSEIGIRPDYLTVHPDKFDEWSQFSQGIEVREDIDCTWSDGSIGGYCLEFYKDNIEIGNIVNTLGTCIDVGFGLERLQMILDKDYKLNIEEILKSTIQRLVDCGILPGAKLHGSIVRKLIREMWKNGMMPFNETTKREYERLNRNQEKYERLIRKHPDKPASWWFDTHGIEVDEWEDIETYEQIQKSTT